MLTLEMQYINVDLDSEFRSYTAVINDLIDLFLGCSPWSLGFGFVFVLTRNSGRILD